MDNRNQSPILDPSFKWLSSATHDAGSDAFRARQQERMKAAEEARKAQGGNVKQIARRKQS